MNKTLLSFAMAAAMSLAVVQPVAAGLKAVEVKPYSAADNGGYRVSIPENFMTENPTGEPYEYTKSFTMFTTFMCYDVNKVGVIMGHRAEGHDNDNGSTIFVVENGTLAQKSGANNYKGTISDVVLENNVWYKLAASYNAENHMWKVYLDGKLVAENDNGQNLKLFGDDPCILALGGRDFNGAFDDFFFYNRALADNEIAFIPEYAEWFSGLQLYYDFEEVIEGTTSQFANKATGADAVPDVVATLKHWTCGNGWEPYVNINAGDETTPKLVLGPRPAGALKLTLTVDGDGSGTVKYRSIKEGSEFELLENATWVSKYIYDFLIEADAESEITKCSAYLAKEDEDPEEPDYTSLISEDGKTCNVEHVYVNGGDSEIFVTFSKATSIDTVGADNEAAPEYFNLQGVRVDSNNMVPGVYVERRGAKTSKILVK